ncbi:HPr family phosphocarrier protein [Candidatus Izemoplasma sp. B36]|uniref:HPr family phosphocarrier protein n=1 Tax=Candidatus Izemoplasma sp. B36 TaxID=3242468 RepID=UPI003556F25A
MEKTITIKSTEGLHAQLANKLVYISTRYDVEVRLEYKNVTVDAKSILSLMSLAVPKGRNVKLIAEGKDAQKAIEEIEKLIG